MFVELLVALTDFDSIINKINKNPKGLEGSKPRVKRAPICSSVLVTGLSKKTTGITIQLYFEHKRSGGGDVDRLECEVGSKTAVVCFMDPKGRIFVSNSISNEYVVVVVAVVVLVLVLLVIDYEDHQ